jgi:hypothetical protein
MEGNRGAEGSQAVVQSQRRATGETRAPEKTVADTTPATAESVARAQPPHLLSRPAPADAAPLQQALPDVTGQSDHPARSSLSAGGPSVLQANHATVRSQRP